MNINATIFVQIINFFICYIILRFLFLRPAVNEINQEEQEQEQIAHAIQRHEHMVAQQQKKHDEEWDKCRHYFKEHAPSKPSADFYVFQRISPSVEPSTISSGELETLVDKTTQLLAHKLEVQ